MAVVDRMRAREYRMTHLLANLGWIDLDFDCSTVCPILLGLMGMCQKRLQDGGTAQIKVNPTQVRQEMGHPVASL